ncbi:hypothetical protein [Cryobacterium sp. Y57]|uniref:hypothetical protein n=1 Tax=Cryobacterium sp. Y57 TaxID=2048287 RepID=UPI0013049EB2|nr:hypothetical protein [Cryobacterium sp. Y57]
MVRTATLLGVGVLGLTTRYSRKWFSARIDRERVTRVHRVPANGQLVIIRQVREEEYLAEHTVALSNDSFT